jgi:chromosome segregation ATPase
MAEMIGSLEFDIIGVDNLTEVTEATKKRIEGLVDATVKGGGKMDDALGKIKQEFTKTYGQIDSVIETNISELKKLEAQQNKLSSQAGKAFQSGNDEEYNRIKRRQEALQGEMATRKKILEDASKSNAELGALEDKLATKTQSAATAHGALRTQVRNAREELAQMEAAGQRGSVAYQ